MSAFVDAYASYNMSLERDQAWGNLLRSNDLRNGLALAQVGLSAVYKADPVGGTIDLRFGPQAITYARALPASFGAAARYGQEGDALSGLQYVRQAFVTWTPHEELTLDLGKWDSLMGAEAIDSQDNFTYTRGLLHWYAQPKFHAGLRAAYQPAPHFGLTAFAANGVNRTLDNNAGKTFGLQARITPSKAFFTNIGYIVGPEESDSTTFFISRGDGTFDVRTSESANKRMRHVADLVVGFHPSDGLSLLLNADFGTEEVLLDVLSEETDYVTWFGYALAGKYALSDVLSMAARFEYYRDMDGFTLGLTNAYLGVLEDSPTNVELISGTLTIEAKPSPHLSIKVDHRFDFANSDLFDRGAGFGQTGPSARNFTPIQPTITLGVVVQTN